MAKNFFQKLNFLFLALKFIKNWYAYPLSYFGLTRNFSIFNLKNGLKLIIRPPKQSTDIHIFTEIWLENEYDDQFLEIQENDIIIDVGAHVGYFSLKAALICNKGKIFAFEPLSDNFKILKRNIEINRIQNIFAKNLAVSNHDGKQKLYLGHDSTNSLVKKKLNHVEVSTVNLESIFNQYNLSKCNILKLDCEGSEYDILLNLDCKILKKIKKICMEYHMIPELDLSEKNLISF